MRGRWCRGSRIDAHGGFRGRWRLAKGAKTRAHSSAYGGAWRVKSGTHDMDVSATLIRGWRSTRNGQTVGGMIRAAEEYADD